MIDGNTKNNKIMRVNNSLYDNDVFKQGEEDKDNTDAHPNVQG